MPKCPYCNNELELVDSEKFYCKQCNRYFKPHVKGQPDNSTVNNEQDEIAVLKKRIAALEAEKQQSQPAPKTKSAISTKVSAVASKVAETPAWSWFKKHWFIICPIVLGLIIFITLMTCLVGIRGIYVNIDNPNEFYSFTATSYEYHGTSIFGGGDYVDKGTWKKSGNKLLLTYNDEDFGKITEENIILKNDGNKVLTLEDEFGMEKTFKRVNIVNYSAVATKVKVTFDPCNGGSPIVKKVKIGSLLGEVSNPTRLGSNFLGWYTAKDGQGSAYNSDERIWDNITYYADWNIEWEISSDGTLKGVECSYDKIPANLVIPNSVTQIADNAFSNCKNIKSITFPDTIIAIGKNAFYGCANLTSLTLGVGITKINEKAFDGCESISSVYISDLDAWLSIDMSSNPLNENSQLYLNNAKISGEIIITRRNCNIPNYTFRNSNITSLLIRSNTVENIGYKAFENCNNLTHINLEDGVISIYDYAFYNCTSLNIINIPNSVISIGHNAFQNTVWDREQTDDIIYAGKVAYRLNVSNPSTIVLRDDTVGIGDAFVESNRYLKNINLPNGLRHIGNNAFYQCVSLKSIEFPNSLITIGDSAFAYCKSIQQITIPSNVISIGNYAFWRCYNITSIHIEGNDIEPTIIGSYAFSENACNSLTFGKGKMEIGWRCFDSCNITSLTISSHISIKSEAFILTPLKTVTYLDGVTTIQSESLSDNSFMGSNNITYLEVYIPASLTTIEGFPFSRRKGVIDIYYQGTKSQFLSLFPDNYFQTYRGWCECVINAYCLDENFNLVDPS